MSGPPAPDIPSWRRVGRVEVAALLGVYPDTVSDYSRRGMPVLEPGLGGRASWYDAVACLAWWREQRPGTLDAAKIRQLEAQAKQAEMRIAERQGEVIPAAEAERVWTEAVLDTRAAVLDLAAAVAPQCVAAVIPGLPLCADCRTSATGGAGVVAASRAVREVLDASARDVLRALARWVPKAAPPAEEHAA